MKRGAGDRGLYRSCEAGRDWLKSNLNYLSLPLLLTTQDFVSSRYSDI